MYYIKCFFIYSFVGFLFETVVSKIRGTKFNSGILFGPWTPIYGIGVVLILILSREVFEHLYLVRWREVVIVFLVLVFVLTFIEWLGGFLIERIFHITFWDYSDFRYNIGKYISLEVSLIWGLLSLVLIYVIHPFIHPLILKIPSFVIYLLMVFFVIDFVFTFVKYKKG